MQHLPRPHIDPNVAHRPRRGVGSCEKNQVAGLCFLAGDDGTLVIDPSGRGAGQVIHTGLGVDPAHIPAAVKAGGWR